MKMKNKNFEEKLQAATSYVTLVMLAAGNLYDVYTTDRKKSPADVTISWMVFLGIIFFGVLWSQKNKKERRKQRKEAEKAFNETLEKWPIGSHVKMKTDSTNQDIFTIKDILIDEDFKVSILMTHYMSGDETMVPVNVMKKKYVPCSEKEINAFLKRKPEGETSAEDLSNKKK